MKIQNCFIDVLLSYQLLFCCGQNSFFHLEKEDTTLETYVKPLLNGTIGSRTSCYMQCLNHEQCCYVQIKHLIDKWLCSLYSSLINLNESTKEPNSNIFSIIDEKKCSSDQAIVDWAIQADTDPAMAECLDWYELGLKTDGIYDIVVNHQNTKVFCDMTNEGGGWTTLQRRIDGSVDFQRTWDEYKNGFGEPAGEHWLGNELIHQMTNKARNSLIRIKGTNFRNVTKYIIFKGFWIEDEANKFKLHTGISEVDQDSLGNDWKFHDQLLFTTFDNDNDRDAHDNCAVKYGGGWWFHGCFLINPNNHYSTTENVPSGKGISWFAWTTHYEVLKRISIAIKRQ